MHQQILRRSCSSCSTVQSRTARLFSAQAAEGKKKTEKLDDAPPTLSAKPAAMLETLQGASEKKLQAAVYRNVDRAHMEAVTLFATYAMSGDDAAVKDLAAKTLPKLEVHKMHIMKLVAAH